MDKLQALFEEASNDHRYADATSIWIYMNGYDKQVRFIRESKDAIVGTSFIFTCLYTSPTWMKMRHFYYPYNQKQLDFRRCVLLIPLGTNEKQVNPTISFTLLYSYTLYNIYNYLKRDRT